MESPSSHRTVHLVDARNAERKIVHADLYRGCPLGLLDEVESQWDDARSQITAGDFFSGLASVGHSHWDWRNKTDGVKAGLYMLIAIEFEGGFQGMMSVLEEPRRSRLSGEPILYVDYLESAPWNLKFSTISPSFLGVGTVLIGEAIRISLDRQFQGRIGLHSLLQAETFYRNRCQMTELGQDINYHDLTYFEFASQQAVDWLDATGGTR